MLKHLKINPINHVVTVVTLILFSLNTKAVIPSGLKSLNLSGMSKRQMEREKISEEDKRNFPNFARHYASEQKVFNSKKYKSALEKLRKIQKDIPFENSLSKQLKNHISKHVKNAKASGTGLPVFEMKILKTRNPLNRQYTIIKLFRLKGFSSEKSIQMLRNVISNEAFMTLQAQQFSKQCGIITPNIESWGFFSDFNNEDDSYNSFGYISMSYFNPKQWTEFEKIECPRSSHALAMEIVKANSCLQTEAGIFHNDIFVQRATPSGVSQGINAGNLMKLEGAPGIAILDYGEAIPTNIENNDVTEAMKKMAREEPCKFFKKAG